MRILQRLALKACRNLFLSGKNSPSTHSSANGQILTRTFEQKWLPNDRAIELLIRDWKLGTPNLAKIGTKISKRATQKKKKSHIFISKGNNLPTIAQCEWPMALKVSIIQLLIKKVNSGQAVSLRKRHN